MLCTSMKRGPFTLEKEHRATLQVHANKLLRNIFEFYKELEDIKD
jgi:hypothetical protein